MSSRTTPKTLGHNNRPTGERKIAIAVRNHRMAMQMADHADYAEQDDDETTESFWDMLNRSIATENAAADDAERDALSAEMADY